VKKIGYIAIIGLLFIFLIPIGECASTVYLNPYQFIERSFSVSEGDVIRGDYETYDNPFIVYVCYWYSVDDNWITISTTYTSGWFEIEITGGSGTLKVSITNMDIYYQRSGYLEYTIGKEGDDELNLMPIIIGVVIGVIVICIVIGVGIHYKNKKREIIEIREPVKEKGEQENKKDLLPEMVE